MELSGKPSHKNNGAVSSREKGESGGWQELLAAEEHERKKLAWDLEQRIVLDLSLLKAMSLSLAETPFPEEYFLRQELRRFGEQLDGCLENVQELANKLDVPDLAEIDFSRALKSLCREMEMRLGIKIGLRTSGLGRLTPQNDQALSLAFYRILQEALSNVERHAKATSVEVRLVAAGSSVIMSVDDNGCGFESATILTGTNGHSLFGLRRIQERVSMLQGRFDIRSTIGQGTRLVVELPWREGRGGSF